MCAMAGSGADSASQVDGVTSNRSPVTSGVVGKAGPENRPAAATELLRIEAGDVNAGTVTMERAGAEQVTAQRVVMTNSGARTVAARSVQIDRSGILAAQR